jgi:hypothetical protein
MNWSEEERKKRIQTLVESCPEFIRAGAFSVMEPFWCPIALVDIEVKETVVEEYSSVELLILRLCFYGIRSADEIGDITGLDRDMVLKILQTEMLTYNHIDSEGNLTEVGLETLRKNEGKNADEIVEQTALYIVRREIQVEAATGMVLKAGMELPKSSMQNADAKWTIPPREKIEIDDIVQKDINSRLMEYERKGYISKDDAVYEITNAVTTDIRYRDAFFVKPDHFKYPFIALPYSKFGENKKRKKCIEPLAVSRTDFNCLEIEEEKAVYAVRDDLFFKGLANYVHVFETMREKRLEQEFKDNDMREGE